MSMTMARSSRKKRTHSSKKEPAPDLKMEIWGIILMGVAILLGGGLLSLQLENEKIMGPFGQLMGLALYVVFGLGGYLVVVAIFSMALGLLTRRFDPRRLRHWLGYLLATLFGTIILHLLFPSYRLEGISAGGRTGEVVGEFLVSLFSKPGTFVISLVGMLVSLILATQESVIEGTRKVARWAADVAKFLWNVAVSVGGWVISLFAWEQESVQDGVDGAMPDDDGDEPSERAMDQEPPPQEDAGGKREPAEHPAGADDDRTESAVPQPVVQEESLTTNRSSRNESSTIPTIVEGKHSPRLVDEKEFQRHVASEVPFDLPPLALLQDPPEEDLKLDRAKMEEKAKLLVSTLRSYGIEGQVRQIHVGPVVTQYEFTPKEGTRLSKITALSGEIAMALQATKVRIVAPIPGKNAVGIEIPNERREIVYLKELLMDEKFATSKSKLTVALGKDIKGRTVLMDLAKAPHALVAGTTGSGKSVALNAILMSILYRATPHDVRLIIVDPKQVEFAPYEGIPHLLLPVVTEPEKANAALQWAVKEMEERYEKLRLLGVREVNEYNRKLASLEEKGEVPTDTKGNPLAHLPYIIIVIDEFADLIQTAGKEVELAVARLGQKARAAGIHLIVATQRPSADVITGIIRSNITTRLAFLVANKTDSRVILDQGGAETLLGHGDMLFMDRGLAPIRVHGAFVSTSEVNSVCEFLKEQGEPEYDMDILARAEAHDSGDGPSGEVDSLFDKAVYWVSLERVATVNLLQRKLGIGYPRARRLMDQLEEHGIVSPPKGGKGEREVLVPPPPDAP